MDARFMGLCSNINSSSSNIYSDSIGQNATDTYRLGLYRYTIIIQTFHFVISKQRWEKNMNSFWLVSHLRDGKKIICHAIKTKMSDAFNLACILLFIEKFWFGSVFSFFLHSFSIFLFFYSFWREFRKFVGFVKLEETISIHSMTYITIVINFMN